MKVTIADIVDSNGYTFGSQNKIRRKTFRERIAAIPREVFAVSVQGATTWLDVAKAIGVYRISPKGSKLLSAKDRQALAELSAVWEIDSSHIKDVSHKKKIHTRQRVEDGLDVDEIISVFFSADSEKNVSWPTLTRLIRDYNLLPSQCSECGISPKWNGRPLSLHIDHINGVRSDNRIENLRTLCPNCHSQTDTYSAKNKKTPRMVDLVTSQKV